jgi:hypothetical protein
MANRVSYYAIHDPEGRIKSLYAVNSDSVVAIMQPPPGYLVSQVNAADLKGIGEDSEQLLELMKHSRIDISKPVRLIREKH